MRTDGYSGEQGGRYEKPPRKSGRELQADSLRQQKIREEPDSPAYRELMAQLTEYYRRGVKVSLGGVRMPVSRIARICAVREEGKYMGDYIMDESGELTEIRFDRVSR